jgi:tetratricopeptide (TPR) repeat protein
MAIPTTPASPTPAEVREELALILRSPGFIRSKRLGRFLRFLVEKTLAGQGNLREHVLANEVFDRVDQFDPRVDSIVRVEARRLRRRLREYYQATAGHRVVIDLHPGSYVPEFSTRRPHHVLPAQGELQGGAPTTAAYLAYLQFRVLLNQVGRGACAEAIRLAERLVSEHPSYALAYAGLAEAHWYAAMFGKSRAVDSFRCAKRAAETALQLGPDLADAHSALAAVSLYLDWDWDRALVLAERALELSPQSSFAHRVYGLCVFYHGHAEEGLAAMQQAVLLEPLSVQANLGLGFAYWVAGARLPADQETQALSPASNGVSASGGVGSHVVSNGERQDGPGADDGRVEAEKWFQAALAIEPDCLPARFYIALMKSDTGELSRLAGVVAHAANGISGGDRSGSNGETGSNGRQGAYFDPAADALIALLSGNQQKAFAALRRAFDDRSPLATQFPLLPVFESLRNEPEGQELLKHLGLPHGLWPDGFFAARGNAHGQAAREHPERDQKDDQPQTVVGA